MSFISGLIIMMNETSFLEADSFLDLPPLRLVAKDFDSKIKIVGSMFLSDGKLKISDFELGK